MQYVDSNGFLNPALYQLDIEPKAKKAKQILKKIESGELHTATQTLTLDESVLGTNQNLMWCTRLCLVFALSLAFSRFKELLVWF